jgi:non-ribosomal peptide synthetase component F
VPQAGLAFPFMVQLSEAGFGGQSSWKESVWATFWRELVAPSELQRPASLGVPAGLEVRHAAEWWVASCRAHLAEPALVYADGAALSYEGMLRQATRLCGRLQGLGVAAEDVVAVDAPRHLGLPVWILGIWMAGATYLPLGSRDSAERKRRVAELGRARCVLVAEEGEGAGWALPTVAVGALPQEEADAAAAKGLQAAGEARVTCGKVAYLITTSGSTGEPKVIAISHRAFSCWATGRQGGELQLGPSDRVMQASMNTFDVHLIDNVVPHLVGARCLLVPEELLLESEPLLGQLDRLGCTGQAVACFSPRDFSVAPLLVTIFAGWSIVPILCPLFTLPFFSFRVLRHGLTCWQQPLFNGGFKKMSMLLDWS